MAEKDTCNETSARFIPSTRFTLGLLVSFCFFVQYEQRLSLSIAIVCMVDKNSAELESMPFLVRNASTTSKSSTNDKIQWLKEKQFQWNELEQQIILGAYWVGYILTLVPGKFSTLSYSKVIHFSISKHHRWLVVDEYGRKKNHGFLSIN